MPGPVRNFLTSYWLAVRRSCEDSRARLFVLKATLFTLYLVAYAGFVVYTASDGWTGAFYGFIFVSGTGAAILMRRWHRKQDEILNTSLTGSNPLRPQEFTVPVEGVRAYLHERALILAALLVRGANEIQLATSPEAGTHGPTTTRQSVNGFLRERELWPKLERAECELASVADGQWTEPQQNRVIEWCEQLRLLRWVLGIDAEIVPLAHFPKLDFALAAELLRDQTKRQSGRFVEGWEVRSERDAALQYTARFVAEMKARGHFVDDPGSLSWADEFRAGVIGGSTDFLAGARTVADLRDVELQLLGSFAYARGQYATYLVDQLNSAQVVPFSTWLENQERQ